MAFRLHHCHKSCRWLCRVHWILTDREQIAQVTQSNKVDAGRVDVVKVDVGRVTSPTSNMFRQHLKCSLTAPRRAGTSFGFFFCLFLFTQPAVCNGAWEILVQRCLGQPVDVLAPWPSAAVIPRPRRLSTAVHFQSVERRVQRNLEGLGNVRFDPDELPGCRAATLTFFFFNAYAGRGRRERA